MCLEPALKDGPTLCQRYLPDPGDTAINRFCDQPGSALFVVDDQESLMNSSHCRAMVTLDSSRTKFSLASHSGMTENIARNVATSF